jgi:hypothetical protein
MNALLGLLLSCLLACAAPGASAATLIPEDASISLTGESGKQSETRTIRFELAVGEKTPALNFTPGDLQRTTPTPSRIDRAQVRVTASAASAPGSASYEVAVTGLPERYGTYQGKIQVSNGDAKLHPPISVTLLVRVPATLPLTASPPNIALQLAAGSRPAASVLSNWPSAASTPVAVAGLPAGAEIADARISPLVSVRGYGEFHGDYGATKRPSGLVFHADASKARPDKYTSVAEMDLAGSDRRVSVPVEVSVRVSPWCVIALLLAGIVLGRGAKWMNEQGQKLLAARQRVNDFEARTATLDADYRRHLYDKVARLHFLVSQKRLTDLDAAMVDAVARADLLERAASLRHLAWTKNNVEAEEKLKTIAEEAGFVTNPETLKPRLDAIEIVLTTEPGADALTSLKEPKPPPAPTCWTLVQLAGALRWILELTGVVLLAFVGYEVLYLNGSATFGANFSDYFGALVWGLGADVTARTITSLGRTPVF